MVEIFGALARSRVVEGQTINTFRIPAVSKRAAKGRASFNARIKGLSEFTTDEPEVIDENTSIPGQKIYEVDVRANSS